MNNIKGWTCEICGKEIPINWECVGYCDDEGFHAIHLYHEGSPEYIEWCKNAFDTENWHK